MPNKHAQVEGDLKLFYIASATDDTDARQAWRKDCMIEMIQCEIEDR